MAEDAADLAIIGGGAAGLTTAIFAAEAAAERGLRGQRIVVLDSSRIDTLLALPL